MNVASDIDCLSEAEISPKHEECRAHQGVKDILATLACFRLCQTPLTANAI